MSAWVKGQHGPIVEIEAHSTSADIAWARRSRAGQINATRRVWEVRHGKSLTRLSSRMSETYGFAHSTIARFGVTDKQSEREVL